MKQQKQTNKRTFKVFIKIKQAVKCPKCSNIAKKVTKRNYPFGKKSKSVRTEYFVCKNCGWRKLII